MYEKRGCDSLITLENLEMMLLEKVGSKIDFPFGEDVMVFKVLNKMFALVSLNNNPLSINLKALPEDALAYREIYECVSPGYHMNKKHWNTITLDGSMQEEVLKDMIDESYNLVVEKLTKKEKGQLK
ncbi:MAG: MmcQ/YjbR family DNA-binding protein [Arcobacteraceae bacterium]